MFILTSLLAVTSLFLTTLTNAAAMNTNTTVSLNSSLNVHLNLECKDTPAQGPSIKWSECSAAVNAFDLNFPSRAGLARQDQYFLTHSHFSAHSHPIFCPHITPILGCQLLVDYDLVGQHEGEDERAPNVQDFVEMAYYLMNKCGGEGKLGGGEGKYYLGPLTKTVRFSIFEQRNDAVKGGEGMDQRIVVA